MDLIRNRPRTKGWAGQEGACQHFATATGVCPSWSVHFLGGGAGQAGSYILTYFCVL